MWNSYFYEVWYDGSYLTEGHGFVSYEEAQEEAEFVVADRREMWEADGAWKESDSMELFSIFVEEES